MALLRVYIGLLGLVSVSLGEPDCSDGECGMDENSLLALRSKSSSGETCHDVNGHLFQCAKGDTCCGNACKAPGDLCCENAEKYKFPCQGNGGSCCGNACAAPGSKCCKVGEKRLWYPVSKDTQCRSPTSGKSSSGKTCYNVNGDPFQCAEGDTCCGNACKAPGDLCCENAEKYKFPCQGNGGSCCGNACAAPGSKCCKVGEKRLWYPVSKDTQCRSPTSGKSSSGKTCYNVNGDPFQCAKGDTCCGNACKAPGDLCCENAEKYKFPCQGNGGSCCGNACAAPGSKCCKVGEKRLWYPVSKDTQCRSPPPPSHKSTHYSWGSFGPPGGINHGRFENDFDWTALSHVKNYDCSRVCRSKQNNYCYPIKDDGNRGTPCGAFTMGDPQGCFFNGPTQTCALCQTNTQPYCCPTSEVKPCT